MTPEHKAAHKRRMLRFAQLRASNPDASLEHVERVLRQTADVLYAKGHTGVFRVKVVHPRGPARVLRFPGCEHRSLVVRPDFGVRVREDDEKPYSLKIHEEVEEE